MMARLPAMRRAMSYRERCLCASRSVLRSLRAMITRARAGAPRRRERELLRAHRPMIRLFCRCDMRNMLPRLNAAAARICLRHVGMPRLLRAACLLPDVCVIER